MQRRDGKYIYCIIASEYDVNLGTVGIGGRGDLVTTIGLDGLSMVVSNHPLTRFVVNPENILAHQQVIEIAMSEFSSVLPVRFGTIAATPDEIRNLLDRRYNEFMELLHRFENKVELNVRGNWKDMKDIYKEIDKECVELQRVKNEIKGLKDNRKRKLRIEEAGNLIKQEMKRKKDQETEKIMDFLRRSVFDYKCNKTDEESMFINAAFLVNSGREVEFDNIMEELGGMYQNRSDFVYATRLPIFNFIELKIFPEKWEI